MRIGVPKEIAEGERRVALVPDIVRKLVAGGHEVVIEPGAGASADLPDAAFADAGAQIGDPYAGPDVVVRVAPPQPEEIGRLGAETILVGFLQPLTAGATLKALARQGTTSFAMEAIPRISRAQAMDALSSQANVGGYRAALLASHELGRFFPMLMTAAGTIPPAQVLVLGAGVAGLQAIATARRLGAQVTAYDVRAAVKEQVQSLGAKFLELDGSADAEAAGGYARELTEEEQAQQREGLAAAIGRADVVITTALIPGRPAPRLVTAAAVARMKPGSVVVDMAGEAGGNCELTQPGETIRSDNGVIIAAPLNLPSTMPQHSSQLYARNVQSLLELFSAGGEEAGGLALDWEDEVIRGACVTRGGEIVHEGARNAAEAALAAPGATGAPEPAAGTPAPLGQGETGDATGAVRAPRADATGH